MLIQIESVAKDAPRSVLVTPDDDEPFEFTAANLADAHKTLKAGQKDGWDTIRPGQAEEMTKQRIQGRVQGNNYEIVHPDGSVVSQVPLKDARTDKNLASAIDRNGWQAIPEE